MDQNLSPEHIAKLRSSNYNATLEKLIVLHRELAIFRIRPDQPFPPHHAGQYLTLGLGLWENRTPDSGDDVTNPADESKMLRRAYSISHPILDDQGQLVGQGPPRTLDFYIVLVSESSKNKPAGLTPRLFMMKEGDRLSAGEKIAGHYTLEGVKPTDTVLFLATGTGEAPHNYMTWELLSKGHTGPIISVCCVRLKQDLGYLSTHERLMKMYPNYRYVPLTTREPADLGKKIYIQGLIESGDLERRTGTKLDPASTHVYLCGNPKMIGVPTVDKATGARTFPQPRGCVELLESRGFKADQHAQKQRGNIHFEEYW